MGHCAPPRLHHPRCVPLPPLTDYAHSRTFPFFSCTVLRPLSHLCPCVSPLSVSLTTPPPPKRTPNTHTAALPCCPQLVQHAAVLPAVGADSLVLPAPGVGQQWGAAAAKRIAAVHRPQGSGLEPATVSGLCWLLEGLGVVE